jgi:hypothetical protein
MTFTVHLWLWLLRPPIYLRVSAAAVAETVSPKINVIVDAAQKRHME